MTAVFKSFSGHKHKQGRVDPFAQRRDDIVGMAGNQKHSYGSQITASRSTDVYIKPKMFFILGADG